MSAEPLTEGKGGDERQDKQGKDKRECFQLEVLIKN